MHSDFRLIQTRLFLISYAIISLSESDTATGAARVTVSSKCVSRSRNNLIIFFCLEAGGGSLSLTSYTV